MNDSTSVTLLFDVTVYTEFGFISEKRVSPGPPVSADLGLDRRPSANASGPAQVDGVANQRQMRVTVPYVETNPMRVAT